MKMLAAIVLLMLLTGCSVYAREGDDYFAALNDRNIYAPLDGNPHRPIRWDHASRDARQSAIAIGASVCDGITLDPDEVYRNFVWLWSDDDVERAVRAVQTAAVEGLCK